MPKGPQAASTPAPFAPFWQSADGGGLVRLYLGNVTGVLDKLKPKSVQTCITSPPYWGLRSYLADGHDDKHMELGAEPSPDCLTWGQAQCGACFVCNMVAVFRGVKRVLRDDGCCWLNLGDTYSGGGRGEAGGQGTSSAKQLSNAGTADRPRSVTSIPSGNLVGVPWRVALALQADGWVLRQDVIWHKPAPMPESVKNRCTKAHEYVFLLTKRMGYYCDMEAIKVRSIDPESLNGRSPRNDDKFVVAGGEKAATRGGFSKIEEGKTYPLSNKRSVWSVTSSGYPGAHFATFPPALIRPMILAGTSEAGACSGCGAPWERVVEEETVYRDRPNAHVKYADQGPNGQPDQTKAGVEVKTLGWAPSCACVGADGEPLPVVPCVVLDPFVGSGTTVAEAVRLDRAGVGIDLSAKYLTENAVPRVKGALLSRPETAWLAGT